jgi:hypothetical protein
MNNTTINGNNSFVDDNQAYWIALVNLLNKTISQYGLGLIWLVGNIGSTFTCIVFLQPAFHNSPCAMYFIASSLSQYFTFNFVVLTRIVEFGYNVKAINQFLWYCKIRYYFSYIFVAIPRYNIILASIDCYFASSRDALRRQWSSQKIAFRVIIGNIIFWSLIYVQVIVFYKIQNGTCDYQSGIYGRFFSIYISIDSGILPVLLMLIFGLLTIRNVNQTKRRIGPTAVINNDRRDTGGRIAHKDTQLYRMLTNQICIFIILNILNPCYLVYASFTINSVKSPLRATVELFINNMTYVLIDLGFSLTFATFILSSNMFRQEFQRVILTKILHRSPPPTTTAVPTVRTMREVRATY